MKVLTLLILAAIHGSVCANDQRNSLVVSVKNGLLKGKLCYGNEKSYEAFLGVPYAKPPVEDLRFCSPVPCGAWSGTYDATYARNECLQKVYLVPEPFIKGSEDCLYLNIYRPRRRNPNEKLPVVVYFSFGGFAVSFTSPENLSPDYFMDTEKVILVVVQSRVGIFGYLSSGDEHCPGNYALKDQALALQWVHENIDAFDGDCNSVTLLCADDVGGLCQYHWIHHDTSKLFHKVVLKSGNAFSLCALNEHPHQQFFDHAKLIGVDPKKVTSLELTEKLRKTDAKTLLSATDKLDFWIEDQFVFYRPVVEVDCKDAYVRKNPREAWRLGHFDPKPLYMTFTHSEGNVRSSLLLNHQKRKIFNQDVDYHLSEILLVNPVHLQTLKNFYFLDGMCNLADETLFTYLELFTMPLFHQHLYNFLKYYVQHVNTQKYPLSVEKFNFHGNHHFSSVLSGFDVDLNVGFCDDLIYLFRFPSLFPDFDKNSIDYQMKNIYVDTHVNFACTGVANTWMTVAPCDDEYFRKYGFCEYQFFANQTAYVDGVLNNQVTVDITNYFPLEEVHMWNSITENRRKCSKMKVAFVLCFVVHLCVATFSDKGDLIVCPPIGCIQGTVIPGHVRSYEAFMGIPYAKPPVGELRFRNPVPIDPWGSKVWNGTYSRDTCMQKIFASHTTRSYGAEDCLYMNIYRPIRKLKTKLAVIVMITGGGFSSGTAQITDFAPDYMMNRKDIILILPEHRLGVFGYLCSGNSVCPGNFGLKDQQMVLEWVRDNIEEFGGNPSQVTLLGQGSGSACIQMHMMNVKSSLLFHRVILQSGSLAHWALLRNPRSQFMRQVKYAGIKGYKNMTTSEIMENLRNVDAVTLRETVDKFKFWHFEHLVIYRPCIEKVTWEDAFLTENPYDAWRNGRYVPKPVLITFTPNDGTYRSPILTNDSAINDFNARMRKILPKFLEFPSKYVDDVVKFYFGNHTPHIGPQNEEVFINMVSDRYFHQSLYNTVQQLRMNRFAKMPLYLYKFNFNSEFRYTKRTTLTDKNFGTGYRDDLLFMFRIASVFPAIEFDSVEARMSDLYVGVLAHFATFGREKSWLSHEKCSGSVNGFCEYQEFQKFSDNTTSEVLVKASRQFRVDAAEFWNEIDGRK
ncbi:uncharacterized protein LOC132260750 [Phlebotomus argentipes]|uniref:uncharacterized protein LOC132260750 n=1 Tax=Phlebotomus argentipes TaxID=94469 RepID=UPI002892D2C8|nr:uncharacterized protein LOC132260750 [Phlebotomus argentipes]